MNTYRRTFLFILAFVPAAHAGTVVEASRIRPAVEKSVALLQSTGKTWFEKQACTSCHHSFLPTIALVTARNHGAAVNEPLARDHFRRAYAFLTDLDYIAQGIDSTNFAGVGYALWATQQAGLPQNVASAALVQMLASQQRPDGHWRTLDVRPPQSGNLVSVTALSLQALNLYASPKLDGATKRHVARARQWLEAQRPTASEDGAFRLLGAKWGGTAERARAEYAKQLIAQQRPDGGWSQIGGRPSDAYATGQVLFALMEGAAISATNKAIQRGLNYLLNTQLADGSWLAPSRIHEAPVSPPYFETGFPHGKDQVASCSGTSWAVMALSLALPQSNVQPFSLKDSITAQEPWVETALFGSAAEIKQLDPNARTKLGTTALMFAASDAARAKILLDAGADVNARAKSGFSALMVASSFGSNAETVRLLLDRGATLEPPTGAKVLFDRSPLIQAIVSGDLASVKLLVERKAEGKAAVRRKSIFFEDFVMRPLMMAVYFNDLPMAAYLARNGASVDEEDDVGLTPLERAATMDYPDMVELLAGLGGDPNHVDKMGMTPLILASTIEFGSPETVKKLLAAGARADIAGKGGVTPMTQAVKYGLKDVRTALERASPKETR